MKENSALMRDARETLRGNWWLAIGAFFVLFVVGLAAGAWPRVGWLVNLALSGPLALGSAIFALRYSRGKHPRFEQIFDGFRQFGLALGTFLLSALFVLLWLLLLIVPGIIAALRYSQVFYLIADGKAKSPTDAIEQSKRLMDGRKWKYFCLHCRFIGWFLLCILTLGIGLFWLIPYVEISKAKFYDDILAAA